EDVVRLVPRQVERRGDALGGDGRVRDHEHGLDRRVRAAGQRVHVDERLLGGRPLGARPRGGAVLHGLRCLLLDRHVLASVPACSGVVPCCDPASCGPASSSNSLGPAPGPRYLSPSSGPAVHRTVSSPSGVPCSNATSASRNSSSSARNRATVTSRSVPDVSERNVTDRSVRSRRTSTPASSRTLTAEPC